MVFRRVTVLAFALLILAFTSSQRVPFASSQAAKVIPVCHDGVWEDGEFCGRDAFTTTQYPDMNHDCVVDGLDIGAFLVQRNTSGANLSADLNGDGFVTDLDDFLPFFTTIGLPVSPCNVTPVSNVCQGTLALSFSPDSTNIVSNTSQGPGVYTAYVVMDNYANARVVEYAIQTSYNVLILDHRPRSGDWINGCVIGQDNNNIVFALAAPLTAGPAIVATIRYQVTDTSPASLTITPGSCLYRHVRWATADMATVREFAEILNAGINGPTPLPTPCPAMVGTIAGRVYEDVGDDCAFTIGTDSPVYARVIEVNPGGYLVVPDDDGYYSVAVPFGHYTVSSPSLPKYFWKELSTCQVPSYEVDVTTQGTVSGNDFALQPLGTISGRVYSDDGIDCLFTPGADIPVAGRTVEVNPGGYSTVTDAYGNYSISVQIGQYTVSLAPALANDPYKWISGCQGSTHDVDVSAHATTGGNDFPLEPIGVISGRVYRDFGNDCAFDVGTDFPIGNRMIEVNPGGFLAFTDETGYYSLVVPLGQYTVSQLAITNDPWAVQSCQPSASYLVDVDGTSSGNDFALLLVGPPQCDVAVNIVSNGLAYSAPYCPSSHPYMLSPCPGVEHEYVLVVNVDPLSTVPVVAGSTLDITLDPAFTIATVSSECSISPVSSSGANQRTIQFDDPLYPGHLCTVKVRATPTADGPYDTNVLFDDGGLCTGVKTASLTENDECSCDPNDMNVAPPGCGEHGGITGDAVSTYKIRFENLGLGRAHNIYVRDILDADLDVGSLRVVAASHDVTGVQIDAGNKLVISFDGIELPGTFNPQANNKGFVIFMIQPKANLANGTTILNSAQITFDFNDPVVTNTVLNTIQNPPCPATPVDPHPALPTVNSLSQNHPNPFNPSTTIQYGLVSAEQTTIAVYNVRGELVQTLVDGRLPAGWHTVEWNGRDKRGNPVASGVYLYRMRAGSFVETKKLVLLK